MFITIPREEARRRLTAAGYTFIRTLFETNEVWRGPDATERILMPELDGTGCYEEEMIKLAETLSL